MLSFSKAVELVSSPVEPQDPDGQLCSRESVLQPRTPTPMPLTPARAD